MKGLRKSYRYFGLTVFIGLLSGCASDPAKIEPDIRINDVKQTFTREPQALPKPGELRAVKIPKQAPWLANRVKIAYTGKVPAKAAVSAILDKNPVRYELSQISTAKVHAPAEAITVQDHLNAIATQANWDYRIEHGVVIFSDWLTKSYPLAIEPAQRDAALGIAPISNSSGSESDKNDNTLTVAIDPYDELKAMLSALLGEAQSGADSAIERQPRFAVNEASASLTVTAAPNQHREVARAITAYNQRVGQAILIDIAVYNVDRSDGRQRALDFDLLRNAGISLAAKTTTGALLGVDSAPNLFSLTFKEGNAYDNSKVVARALAQSGNTSIITQGQLIAKNNQVSNLQQSDLIDFFEYSVGDQAVSGRLPRYTESIIQVLPTIHQDRINMRLIIINANVEPYVESIEQDREVGGGTTTTSYEVTTNEVRLGKQFVFPVEMRNGETLLIAGLQTDRERKDKVKNQLLPLVGDSVDAANKLSETLVVMTVRLI